MIQQLFYSVKYFIKRLDVSLVPIHYVEVSIFRWLPLQWGVHGMSYICDQWGDHASLGISIPQLYVDMSINVIK